MSNYRLPEIKNAMITALATDLLPITGGQPWIVNAEFTSWAKFKRSIPRTGDTFGGMILVMDQNSPDEEGPFNSFKNRARLRVRSAVHLIRRQDAISETQSTTLSVLSAVKKQVRTTIAVNRDWGGLSLDSYCRDIIDFDDGDKDLMVFDAYAEVFHIWSVP